MHMSMIHTFYVSLIQFVSSATMQRIFLPTICIIFVLVSSQGCNKKSVKIFMWRIKFRFLKISLPLQDYWQIALLFQKDLILLNFNHKSRCNYTRLKLIQIKRVFGLKIFEARYWEEKVPKWTST